MHIRICDGRALKANKIYRGNDVNGDFEKLKIARRRNSFWSSVFLSTTLLRHRRFRRSPSLSYDYYV